MEQIIEQKSTYFFVDDDGTENVSNIAPIRNLKERFWEIPIIIRGKQFDALVELPRGTINTLFGKTLTWDDEPIQILA